MFTKKDDRPLPDNPYQRIVPEIEPITVTEDGVINLLNKLQPNKAGGPENIPSRFLRDYRPFKLISTNWKWYNIMLPASLQTTILIKQVSLQY